MGRVGALHIVANECGCAERLMLALRTNGETSPSSYGDTPTCASMTTDAPLRHLYAGAVRSYRP
jgi:hypothetical protein